ncbi:hypothetical protein DFJ58DRAFT_801181 [Suillus subalutaceus]|uniref:uncharacterized protein n=1 Tax=Suillus subalutaceus TaxID=48586 RepID=UPI001B863B88|nr:uncharacterized protein DFJ58DRAFT_801181 [Suillus subalutaceus]KAG1845319.1 hypothetical protein DFJ58DRAFT_801181 [Suillus subalutaceus]
MFQCLWSGPDGLRCNYPFLAHELSAHLREYHGIRGADKLRVHCSWNDCNKELNKESLSRHVEERHLRVIYPCDSCNKTFTRQYNLSDHKNNCPVQQQ